MQLVLHTERLLLNSPVEGDRADVLRYLNETSDFAENTLNMQFPYLDKHFDYWMEMIKSGLENNDAFIFAVRDKTTEKLMGAVGIHIVKAHQKAEVGYWLAKEYRGHGFITEALKEVIRYGFEQLPLNKIYATWFSHNIASGKILKNCGMKEEAFLKQEYLKQGRFRDTFRYCILRSDFQNF